MDTSTARQHLALVVRHWDDLGYVMAARQTSEWPPAMGVQYIREPDEFGDGRPGDVRPLVINPDVADLRHQITDELTELADHIATQVQRPPVTAWGRQGWTDDIHRQAVLLAAKDAADPRRWRISHPDNTAPHAAAWLLARLDYRPGDGPFRPLALPHLRQITDTAARAAARVETALRLARRTTSTGRQHDGCGGDLHVLGGDGQEPAVVCARCERTWTLHTAA